MHRDVPLEDRVSYAEAVVITGMSRSYLTQRARAGTLTRIGGHGTTVWLSTTEVEQLALDLYRRGQESEYWLTMTGAAAMLGIHRSAAHRARAVGRLPAQRTSAGDWLVRRSDALALFMAGTFRGRQVVGEVSCGEQE